MEEVKSTCKTFVGKKNVAEFIFVINQADKTSPL